MASGTESTRHGLSFGMPEVRAWADFSGDANPIHFDRAHARDAGLDDLVVHGMLALLPIKRAVSQAGRHGQGAGGWRRFQARFRSPVPHDAANALTLHASATGGVDFRLVSADDARVERFRGGWARVDDPGDWLAEHPLPADSFAALDPAEAHRFDHAYGPGEDPWITLDALVFSHFMRTRLDVVGEALQAEYARLTGRRSDRHLFVQVSHTVLVDLGRLPHGAAAIDWAGFRYAMGPPVTVASHHQLAGTVTLPVLQSDRLVMLVEVGLLARPMNR